MFRVMKILSSAFKVDEDTETPELRLQLLVVSNTGRAVRIPQRKHCTTKNCWKKIFE
jgi:hypothetical protein